MTASQYFLLGIVLLIPVVGFISTISHARKADSAREQRWRKSHGLLYWTILPAIFGILTFLSATGIAPKIFGLFAIVLFAGTTFLSWVQQRKREE